MNEMIRTTNAIINNENVNAVNARELHEFLGVGKDFTSWIKNRIEKYDFTKGVDYLLTKIGEQLPSGTKYRTDYIITLDMAKELAMVENNERGKQARQYFIEVEKNARKMADAVNGHVAALIPILQENARLKAENDFASHFLPLGKPGEVNKNGDSKMMFRRGCYCARNGRNIMQLMEQRELPMFEAPQMPKQITFNVNVNN